METLKEKTARGLMWGALNSGATQILNLIFGIILARQLSPRDYGIVGVLTIFSAIAGNLQNCGFTSALINLKKPTSNDYNAVFWFSVSVSALLYIILFFSAPLIALFFHTPELVEVSRLVFIAFFISSIGNASSALMKKNLMVKEVAITGALCLSTSGVVGVILAFLGYGYWALAWQNIVFISVAVFCRFCFTWKFWRPSLSVDFTPIKVMFPFSVKILITYVVNTINNNVLTVLFGNMFPMRQVGNYTQAMKWNSMAFSLISGTIDHVAQPVMAEASDEANREKRIFRKIMRFTAFLSFPALFGLALISHEFIDITIGAKWAESAELLQILCLCGAFMPLYTIYQNLAISAGRSDIYMWCNIVQIVTQIGIILAFHNYGIRTMVIAYSTFIIVYLLVWQAIASRLADIHFSEVLRDILPFMLAAIAVMALTWLATSWISNVYILLVSRILLAALLYFIVMKLAGAKILSECLAFLKRKL